MNRALVRLLILLAISFFPERLWAGGSGYNVLIVVNQNSTNSVQLGNYYRAQRNVPPQNFLRINWTGTNTEWTLANFNSTLVTPLLALLSSQKLTNQIDYVVLSMDIPYRVSNGGNGYNSTTAALFYGFKNDPNQASQCEITMGGTNLYAGSEEIFRSTPPTSAASNSFLVTMITASNLAVAEMTVRQGAASDGTFPTQTVWLGKSTDTARNVRYSEFDNAGFNSRLRGNYSIARTNTQLAYFPGLILGYENGSYFYDTSPVPLFVPGAMADSLTSYGGQIFETASGQTTLLRFMEAGASGSYGTIIEPCNFTEKFPNPQAYFFQSRGFSLAECYYQSLIAPYEGLVVGEPLAVPFARPGTGVWSGLASNAVLAGTTNLAVQFTASDAQHPLQQVDLFVDGSFFETVTNIAPQSGDVLKVTLNGFATSSTVSSGATIKSVTSNLVVALNSVLNQNLTKVSAIDHGDRIELQSTAGFNKTGSQISVAVSSTNPSGAPVTFIRASNPNPADFRDSIAQGMKIYQLSGAVVPSSTLTLNVTKTNNAVVTVSVTNSSNGTFTQFTQSLLNAIGNTTALQGLDGLFGTDLTAESADSTNTNTNDFNLYANGQGFAAAQMKPTLTATSGISVATTGTQTLTDNLTDLEPRNHLYITAGTTNLAVNFPLATTNFTDGYHELEAVAYEGSHVRTQTRATQEVIISNSPLSATFAPLLTGTTNAVQPTLQFTVAANTGNISSVQLFSTGGLLAVISNQSTATFSVTFTNLGVGVHPFYAIVTDSLGHQYRTQTQTIGLIGVSNGGSTLFGVDLPFSLQISAPPPLLVWPATAGRSYTILGATNLAGGFTPIATNIPASSLGQWTDKNANPAQLFYRVSATP